MGMYDDICNIIMHNNHENKIIVYDEHNMILESRRYKQFRRFNVGIDSPHFNGGEKHGHIEYNGHEYSWTITGKRLHGNKFSNHVPNKIKQAMADALKVPVNILEAYYFDSEEDGRVIIVETIKPKLDLLETLPKE